jgi:hypothetical protein
LIEEDPLFNTKTGKDDIRTKPFKDEVHRNKAAVLVKRRVGKSAGQQVSESASSQ